MLLQNVLYDMFLNTPLYLPLELWTIIVKINRKSIFLLADLLEDELLFPEQYLNDAGQYCFLLEDFVEWPRYWAFLYEDGAFIREYHEYGCWGAFEEDSQHTMKWTGNDSIDDGITDVWIFENIRYNRYIFYHGERGYTCGENDRYYSYDNRETGWWL